MEKQFASNLVWLRKKRGLSQEELARNLDISRSTLANYEQGTRFPDKDIEERIAKYFGVTLDTLRGTENGLTKDEIEYLDLYRNSPQRIKTLLRLLAYSVAFNKSQGKEDTTTNYLEWLNDNLDAYSEGLDEYKV